MMMKEENRLENWNKKMVAKPMEPHFDILDFMDLGDG
jgi:hypothetical protein